MEEQYTPKEIADALIADFAYISRNTNNISLKYDIKCAIITCTYLRNATNDPIYDAVHTELSNYYK